jgi:uncharacterized protein (DUF302 family)
MAPLPENGMLHSPSPHTFVDTLRRLQAAIARRSIPILATIDHADGATQAGLSMNPATVVIFGNAKAGTPVMLAAPTAALDLPLKALVWQDVAGQVWISYNTPQFLQTRHQIPDNLLSNIAGITTIVTEAVNP